MSECQITRQQLVELATSIQFRWGSIPADCHGSAFLKPQRL